MWILVLLTVLTPGDPERVTVVSQHTTRMDCLRALDEYALVERVYYAEMSCWYKNEKQV